MAKLLPIIIIVVGLLVGAGVGFVLKPSEPPAADAEKHDGHDDGHAAEKSKSKKKGSSDGHGEKTGSAMEYLEFRRQFVVPVIRENGVKSLMVLDLTIELSPGSASGAYTYEPKLRAAFLETLFHLSHSGMFSNDLTDPKVRTAVQDELLFTAREILGDTARDVLVLGVLRQDL